MIYVITYTIITALAAHFIADFIFQTHYMATDKSKSLSVLHSHVERYSQVFTALVLPITAIFLIANNNLDVPEFLLFCTIYGAGIFLYVYFTHFIVDFVTSKFTSHYFGKQDLHMGFVVVGLDQLIHASTLVPAILYLLTLANIY